VTVDGEVWGVPFNADAGLLYYRKDILRAAGAPYPVPADRDQLLADIEAIAKSDHPTRHKEYQAGYITQLRTYEGLTVNAMEAIWNAGGNLVDRDGKVVTDSGAITRATSGLNSLAIDSHDLMPPSATAADETTSQQAFASGAVAFMRNWPYAYDVLAKKLVPGRDFDVTTLPGDHRPGVSVLGGQNLAISATSKKPEAARALIDFLTSPESERCLLEGGFAATRSSAYDDGPSPPRCTAPAAATPPATTAPGPDTEQAGPTTSAGQLPAYAKTLHKALLTARPRPVTPYYAAFTGLVQSKVGALLRDPTGGDPAAVEDLLRGLGPVLSGRDCPTRPPDHGTDRAEPSCPTVAPDKASG